MGRIAADCGVASRMLCISLCTRHRVSPQPRRVGDNGGNPGRPQPSHELQRVFIDRDYSGLILQAVTGSGREIREYAKLWDEREHHGDGIMLPGVPPKMDSPTMHQWVSVRYERHLALYGPRSATINHVIINRVQSESSTANSNCSSHTAG